MRSAASRAAAAAPILLNLSIMAALALAWFFPSAGHAAAWGVLIAGCLEVLLLAADVTRQGVLPAFRWPRLDEELKLFLKRFGPATLGSAGTQIALFADTIIASFLATGALSALYYADRLNQLPIGVIGIAVGTVLLPEMARRLAAGDEAGARHAQNRAVELTLLLSVPCLVAFLLVPDLIMRALFMRGAFTTADAQAAAATLAAYAIGLLPFVLHAQRDRHLPGARRHRDAGEGAGRLGRRQCRAQDRADGAARAGRAGACDLDRRLGQSGLLLSGLRRGSA